MDINVVLSSHFLEHVLKELAEPIDSSPRALLEIAEDHEMRPLLASAWQEEGIEISPPLAYEVDLYRARFDNHRKLFSELSSEVDNLEVVKGYQIADLYPEGWVRGGKDMDIHAGDQHAVWKAAQFLLDRGWKVSNLYVQRVQDTDNVIVTLKAESLDPMFMRSEIIEVGALAFTGNYFSLRPMLTGSFGVGIPQRVLDMVGVLEQRLERRLIARDVVDAVVLLREMSGEDLKKLWEAVDRLELWKEWRQLVFVLDYLELISDELLSPSNLRGRQKRSILRRRARSVSRALRPSVLARAFLHKVTVREWEGSVAARTAGLLPKLISARRVHQAGLPLVGVPVDSQPAGDGVTTQVVGGRLVVRCPLGTFMAIYSHEYEPDWVLDLRYRLGMAGG